MRAKTVDFERGKDPRHQMGVGRGPTLEDLVNPIIEEKFNEFSDTGEVDLHWEDDVPNPPGLGPVTYADNYLVVTIPCSNKEKRREAIALAGGTYMNPSGNNNLHYELDNAAYKYSQFLQVNMEPKAYGVPRKGVKIYIAFSE